MQKDELVQLHSFLLQIRGYLENMMDPYDCEFISSYDDVDVQPQQIFKSKHKQELAVFELCLGIERVLHKVDPLSSRRMLLKLEEICIEKRDKG